MGGWGSCRRQKRVDKLLAQVKWKGMCLDIEVMIVACSNDTHKCGLVQPRDRGMCFCQTKDLKGFKGI